MFSRYVIVDLLNVKWNTFISENPTDSTRNHFSNNMTFCPGRKFYTQFFTFFLFFILSSSVFLSRCGSKLISFQ